MMGQPRAEFTPAKATLHVFVTAIIGFITLEMSGTAAWLALLLAKNIIAGSAPFAGTGGPGELFAVGLLSAICGGLVTGGPALLYAGGLATLLWRWRRIELGMLMVLTGVAVTVVFVLMWAIPVVNEFMFDMFDLMGDVLEMSQMKVVFALYAASLIAGLAGTWTMHRYIKIVVRKRLETMSQA